MPDINFYTFVANGKVLCIPCGMVDGHNLVELPGTTGSVFVPELIFDAYCDMEETKKKQQERQERIRQQRVEWNRQYYLRRKDKKEDPSP